jgi:pimeloyl-ACP methyl ester carboxylesterase
MTRTPVDGAPRPFKIAISEGDLDDLRERLGRTRWPDELPGAEWSRGVPLDYLKELVDYWRAGYDWREHEARINELPQFTATIDGQTIHFVHVRSPEPAALPLILTHGWPGSFLEFMELIGPLSDPAAHGADARDAFDVVCPSIPGFGFSAPVRESGWEARRTSEAFAALMGALGYERYGAHGGDWGSRISRDLGLVEPERVAGIHLSTLITLPPRDPARLKTLSEADQQRLQGNARFLRDGAGYFSLQSTRPQTLAYGLTDSPVGQLAWIIEKFKEWTDSDRVPEEAIDRDRLLTNVTLYWLTATAGSSADIYYNAAHAGAPLGAPEDPSPVPTAVAVFPHDIVPPIRSLAEQTNNIVRWTEFDRGGHFAAMEEPDLLIGDIREFFRVLR